MGALSSRASGGLASGIFWDDDSEKGRVGEEAPSWAPFIGGGGNQGHYSM
jgi:hypothetical protein